MYQRFPGDGASPSGPPTAPATMPQSVQRAVRVMYAGAAASLIGIAVDLTALSAIRSAITKRSATMTAAQVSTAVHVEVGFLIAGGLIGAALWLWMAQSCKAGKGWARIVSTVFFGIDTLSALASVGTGLGGGATGVYGLVVWVIGLVAVILLWQRPSSGYFGGARRY
jgi:hypothetical protein